jgi:hypothetical protein
MADSVEGDPLTDRPIDNHATAHAQLIRQSSRANKQARHHQLPNHPPRRTVRTHQCMQAKRHTANQRFQHLVPHLLCFVALHVCNDVSACVWRVCAHHALQALLQPAISGTATQHP